MKQILAVAVTAALLGACSDINPFGGDSPSADASPDKKAAVETVAAPKRVVIARLEDKQQPDPKALERIAPASRPDPTRTSATRTPTDDRDADDPAARDDDPAPDGTGTPKADEDFVNYLKGKKATPRRARRTVRTKPRKAKTAATDPNHFELDKIAPGAGPGRKTGKIDDAFSADRDFIQALMTDSKPVRKRARRAAPRKRVVARPTPRKRVSRKASKKMPRKTKVIRIARKPKPAGSKRVATRKAPPKAVARRPKRSTRKSESLATLEGADAADKEVLKVLGAK